MEYEKGTIDMKFYKTLPPECSPGVQGCTHCRYEDCIYSGQAVRGEIPRTEKKTATAVTVTAVKRFSKYSTSQYTTSSPRKVNSMFPENSLSYFLVGGV